MDSMCEWPLEKQTGNTRVLLCYIIVLLNNYDGSLTDMLLWQALDSRLLIPCPHVDPLVHQLYHLHLDQPLPGRVESLGVREGAMASTYLLHQKMVKRSIQA
jgi:hypothetical protein